MSVYLWNQGWEHERERLTVQARIWDPGTVRHLEALGVALGWRCAEIGAGAGSVTDWLCRRVGPTGRVLATDIDTRFVSLLEHTNLDVRQHDIVQEPLEPGGFDLLHTRLLLMHLPGRTRALEHMQRALRPGGWLLVEDYDLRTSALFQPPSALQARMAEAIMDLFVQAGADPCFGSQLDGALAPLGLERTGSEARLTPVALGSPLAEALALKLEQFRARLVAAGRVTDAEVGEAIAQARTASGTTSYPPLMVAAWGRRPT